MIELQFLFPLSVDSRNTPVFLLIYMLELECLTEILFLQEVENFAPFRAGDASVSGPSYSISISKRLGATENFASCGDSKIFPPVCITTFIHDVNFC